MNKINVKFPILLVVMIFALSFFVSATVTSIITSSPADNAWTNNNQTDFNFTAISNVSLTFGCTLVVDDVVYAGDAAVANDTETTLTPVSELSDGSLEWFVNCTDGELNSSANKTLNVDTAVPVVSSLNLPTDAGSTSDTNVTFNFSSYDIMDGVLDYVLFLNGVANETGTTAGNDTTTQFSVPYLTNGTTYTWLIQVTDEAGNSANSSAYTFTVADTTSLITTPTLVAANVNDSDADGNIEVAWTADANAYSYRVYRSSTNITTAASLTEVANTTSTSFEDNTSSNGTTYWYAISSLDFAGNENKSLVSDSFNATANDTIIPELVSGLVASTSSNGAVSLSWTAMSQDVDGNAELQVTYSVFRTTNISALNTSASTELLGTTTSAEYTDTGMTTGTNYSYVVTSYDDAGNENTTISTNNVSIVPSACTTDYGEWSAWSLCHSSERERTRTRTCYGGGDETDTDTMMCTRTPSGGSGSSGGDSAGTGTSFADKTWSMVVANQENVATVSDDASPVLSVSFVSDKALSNVRLIVNEQTTTPDVGAPTADVYKYISIEKEVLTNEDVVSATIEFKLEKSWLVENGFESSRVVLQRFADGGWNDLETNMYQEDDDFAYFRASTPGFSYFAITASEVFSAPNAGVGTGVVEEQTNAVDLNETEPLNESQEQTELGESSNWFWWIIIVVLILIVVYFGWREYSERKEKRLRNERMLVTIRKAEEARKFEQAKTKPISKVASKPLKPIKKVKRK